jgi:hypothetical protein
MPRVGFEPKISVFEQAKILLIQILRHNYVRNNCIILAEKSCRQRVFGENYRRKETG